MPSMRGASEKAFNFNVRELIKSGKPRKQALAIAFKKRREARGGKRK